MPGRGIIGGIVLVWLLIGVFAAWQRDYFAGHGKSLLPAYLAIELEARRREPDGTRIVAENATWVALVPFWAVWPFELMLLPRDPVATLTALTPAQREQMEEWLLEKNLSFRETHERARKELGL